MDDESKRWQEYLEAVRQDALEKHAQQIAHFLALARAKGLSIGPSHLEFSHAAGVVATYPGLLNLFLGDQLKPDKEGLFSLGDLSAHFSLGIREGHLYGQQLVAVAHPHFRRAYSGLNNFCPRFIELFFLHAWPKDSCYIALDPNRLRVDVDHCGYGESDTWFGPDFSEAIEDIPCGIGKLRPAEDLDERFLHAFFADSYALDYRWSEKNQIKSFQALELKNNRVQVKIGNEWLHPAKYVHAEYDLITKTFRHFDGAVQYFDEASYLARRDSDFNYNLKNPLQIKAPSTKLFKINCPTSVATWVELTSHFFSANPLITEYFTGTYPDYVIEGIERFRAREMTGIV